MEFYPLGDDSLGTDGSVQHDIPLETSVSTSVRENKKAYVLLVSATQNVLSFLYILKAVILAASILTSIPNAIGKAIAKRIPFIQSPSFAFSHAIQLFIGKITALTQSSLATTIVHELKTIAIIVADSANLTKNILFNRLVSQSANIARTNAIAKTILATQGLFIAVIKAIALTIASSVTTTVNVAKDHIQHLKAIAASVLGTASLLKNIGFNRSASQSSNLSRNNLISRTISAAQSASFGLGRGIQFFIGKFVVATQSSVVTKTVKDLKTIAASVVASASISKAISFARSITQSSNLSAAKAFSQLISVVQSTNYALAKGFQMLVGKFVIFTQASVIRKAVKELKTISAIVADSVNIAKLISFKRLAGAVNSGFLAKETSLVRRVTQSSSYGFTRGFRMAIGKFIVSTVGSVIRKTVQELKTISATVSDSVTLSKAKSLTLAILQSSSLSPTKAIGKFVSASQGAAYGFTKGFQMVVGKIIIATDASVVRKAVQELKTISATALSSVSVLKNILFNRTASQSATSTLTKFISKTIIVSQSIVAYITKAINKLIQGINVATQVSVNSDIILHLKAISVAVANSASLMKAILFNRLATQSESLAQNKFIAKTTSSIQSLSYGFVKGFQMVVGKIIVDAQASVIRRTVQELKFISAAVANSATIAKSVLFNRIATQSSTVFIAKAISKTIAFAQSLIFVFTRGMQLFVSKTIVDVSASVVRRSISELKAISATVSNSVNLMKSVLFNRIIVQSSTSRLTKAISRFVDFAQAATVALTNNRAIYQTISTQVSSSIARIIDVSKGVASSVATYSMPFKAITLDIAKIISASVVTVAKDNIREFKMIAISVANSVSIAKAIVFNRFVNQSSSLTRNVAINKAVSISQSIAFTFAKGVQIAVGKIIVAIQASVARMTVQELKAIAASVSNSVSVAKSTVYAIQLLQSSSLNLTKFISKAVSAGQAIFFVFAKGVQILVGKTIVASVGSVARKTVQELKAITATVGNSVTLSKAKSLTLTVLQSSTLGPVKAITKFVSAAQGALYGFTKGFQMVVGKVIVSIQASMVKKSIAELKAIAASVANSVNITKNIFFNRAFNQVTSVARTNAIHKNISAIQGSLVAIAKLVALTLSASVNTIATVTKTHIAHLRTISVSVFNAATLVKNISFNRISSQSATLIRGKAISRAVSIAQSTFYVFSKGVQIFVSKFIVDTQASVVRRAVKEIKTISATVSNSVSIAKSILFNRSISQASNLSSHKSTNKFVNAVQSSYFVFSRGVQLFISKFIVASVVSVAKVAVAEIKAISASVSSSVNLTKAISFSRFITQSNNLQHNKTISKAIDVVQSSFFALAKGFEMIVGKIVVVIQSSVIRRTVSELKTISASVANSINLLKLISFSRNVNQSSVPGFTKGFQMFISKFIVETQATVVKRAAEEFKIISATVSSSVSLAKEILFNRSLIQGSSSTIAKAISKFIYASQSTSVNIAKRISLVIKASVSTIVTLIKTHVAHLRTIAVAVSNPTSLIKAVQQHKPTLVASNFVFNKFIGTALSVTQGALYGFTKGFQMFISKIIVDTQSSLVRRSIREIKTISLAVMSSANVAKNILFTRLTTQSSIVSLNKVVSLTIAFVQNTAYTFLKGFQMLVGKFIVATQIAVARKAIAEIKAISAIVSNSASIAKAILFSRNATQSSSSEIAKAISKIVHFIQSASYSIRRNVYLTISSVVNVSVTLSKMGVAHLRTISVSVSNSATLIKDLVFNRSASQASVLNPAKFISKTTSLAQSMAYGFTKGFQMVVGKIISATQIAVARKTVQELKAITFAAASNVNITKAIFLSTLVTQNISATITKLIGKTLEAIQSAVATLAKNISLTIRSIVTTVVTVTKTHIAHLRTILATVGSPASLVKAVQQHKVVTTPLSFTFVKHIRETLYASQGAVYGFIKGFQMVVGKILSSTQITLARTTIAELKTISLTVANTANLNKAIAFSRVVAQSSTVALFKTINKFVIATQGTFASIVKNVSLTILASVNTVTDTIRDIVAHLKTIAVSVANTANLSKEILFTRFASQVNTINSSKIVSKYLQLSQTTVYVFTRGFQLFISKFIVAIQAVVVRRAIAELKTITASVFNTASIIKSIAFNRNASQSSTIAPQKFISKATSFTQAMAYGFTRGFQMFIGKLVVGVQPIVAKLAISELKAITAAVANSINLTKDILFSRFISQSSNLKRFNAIDRAIAIAQGAAYGVTRGFQMLVGKFVIATQMSVARKTISDIKTIALTVSSNTKIARDIVFNRAIINNTQVTVTKSINKAISIAQGISASIVKYISLTIIGSVNTVVTVNRASIAHIKAVSASVSSTVNLTKSILFNRAIGQSVIVNLTKVVSKTITFAQTAAYSFTKGFQMFVAKFVVATQMTVSKLTVAELKTISATVANSISLNKLISFNREISQASSATLSKAISKLIVLVQTMSYGTVKAVGILVGRILTVTQSSVVRKTIADLKTISTTVASSVSLAKVVELRRLVAQLSSLSLSRTIAQFISVSQQTAYSLAKGFQMFVGKIIIEIQASMVRLTGQELKTIATTVANSVRLSKRISFKRFAVVIDPDLLIRDINFNRKIIQSSVPGFTKGFQMFIAKFIVGTVLSVARVTVQEIKNISATVANSVNLTKSVLIRKNITQDVYYSIRKNINITISRITVTILYHIHRYVAHEFLALETVVASSINLIKDIFYYKSIVSNTQSFITKAASKVIRLAQASAAFLNISGILHHVLISVLVNTRRITPLTRIGSAVGRFATGLHPIGYGEYAYEYAKILLLQVNLNKNINQSTNASLAKRIGKFIIAVQATFSMFTRGIVLSIAKTIVSSSASVAKRAIQEFKYIYVSVSTSPALTKSIFFNRVATQASTLYRYNAISVIIAAVQTSVFVFAKGVQLLVGKIIATTSATVVKRSISELKTISATVYSNATLVKDIYLSLLFNQSNQVVRIKAVSATINLAQTIAFTFAKGVQIAVDKIISATQLVVAKISLRELKAISITISNSASLAKFIMFNRNIIQSSNLAYNMAIDKSISTAQNIAYGFTKGFQMIVGKILIMTQSSVVKRAIRELKTITATVGNSVTLSKAKLVTFAVVQSSILSQTKAIAKFTSIAQGAAYGFTKGFQMLVGKIVVATQSSLVKVAVAELKTITATVANSITLSKSILFNIFAQQYSSLSPVKFISRATSFIQNTTYTFTKGFQMFIGKFIVTTVLSVAKLAVAEVKLISATVSNSINIAKAISFARSINQLNSLTQNKAIDRTLQAAQSSYYMFTKGFQMFVGKFIVATQIVVAKKAITELKMIAATVLDSVSLTKSVLFNRMVNQASTLFQSRAISRTVYAMQSAYFVFSKGVQLFVSKFITASQVAVTKISVAEIKTIATSVASSINLSRAISFRRTIQQVSIASKTMSINKFIRFIQDTATSLTKRIPYQLISTVNTIATLSINRIYRRIITAAVTTISSIAKNIFINRAISAASNIARNISLDKATSIVQNSIFTTTRGIKFFINKFIVDTQASLIKVAASEFKTISASVASAINLGKAISFNRTVSQASIGMLTKSLHRVILAIVHTLAVVRYVTPAYISVGLRMTGFVFRPMVNKVRSRNINKNIDTKS